jgi:mono/diheme cytochrome c family protein
MLKHATQAAAIALVLFFASRAGLAQGPGADTFKAKCVACHGEDGTGNNPVGKSLGVQPYNAPDVLKLSDADLTAIIKNGKNKMPAFAGKVTDAQIKDLLVHIHTLQKKK